MLLGSHTPDDVRAAPKAVPATICVTRSMTFRVEGKVSSSSLQDGGVYISCVKYIPRMIKIWGKIAVDVNYTFVQGIVDVITDEQEQSI